MSDYFRTLSRLRGTASAKTPVAQPEVAGVPYLPAEESAGPRSVDGQSLALGGLLDTVRSLATKSSVPTIVVAAASGTEPATAIVSGLVEQAVESGLRVFVGKFAITRGHRVLNGQTLQEHVRAAAPLAESVAAPLEPLSLDLATAIDSDEAATWMRQASRGQDLVLIEAPPLLKSVEAALLAKRGDGLLIVIEPLATNRDELRVAVERCEATGCRLLGLVSCSPARSLGGRLKRLLRLG